MAAIKSYKRVKKEDKKRYDKSESPTLRSRKVGSIIPTQRTSGKVYKKGKLYKTFRSLDKDYPKNNNRIYHNNTYTEGE